MTAVAQITEHQVGLSARTKRGNARGRSRVLRDPVGDYADLAAPATEEHEAWRARLLSELEDGPPRGQRDDRTRLIDELGVQLLSIALAVADAYGTPNLGNKSDPVDELVYIILSRRTREGAYQAAYEALKSRFPAWEQLVVLPTDVVNAADRGSVSE
jgi:DNA (cytosine-5)-methyltransferase 1